MRDKNILAMAKGKNSPTDRKDNLEKPLLVKVTFLYRHHEVHEQKRPPLHHNLRNRTNIHNIG